METNLHSYQGIEGFPSPSILSNAGCFIIILMEKMRLFTLKRALELSIIFYMYI